MIDDLTGVKAVSLSPSYAESIVLEEREIFMSNQNLMRAARFAPIVERVHGEHHPELTRVREITQALQRSDSAARASELFQELRTVTSGYVIPNDVCEAFAATYEALELADREHSGVKQ